MKKGLILEGGGLRGMFTAGVLDVLMENEIEFDGAVGVSAGAAFGCNYKSKQIGRALRYNKRFCRDKRYCGIYSLITDGNIFSKNFCYDEVPFKYDVFDFETFRKNPMKFYAVCTDIETGKAIYKDCDELDGKDFDWIRASSSMPIVSQIVEIDGLKLLDGAIADSIPIKYFENQGYDKNIVILTQTKSFRKKRAGALPLIKLAYKKYPHLVNGMANRHILYNETLDYISEKEKTGEIIVLRPETKPEAGRIEKNPQKLQNTYDHGRQVAEKALCRIKEYLNTPVNK